MKTKKLLSIVITSVVIVSLISVTALAGHGGGHGGHGGGHGGGHHGNWGHVCVGIGVGVPIYPEYSYWGGYYPYYPYYSPVVVAAEPVVVRPAPVVYRTIAVPPATSYVAGVQVPDYDGLIATRAKTQVTAQAATEGPQTQTLSEVDKLADEGIKAFGSQNYTAAIEKFRAAVRLEPNDTLLPLIYAQALFANNEYEKAASVLVTVLSGMGPKQQPEIFYPRGMYSNDAVLQGQIKNLERAVSMDPGNADMHLLLGYHYLGIDKFDEAMAAIVPALNDKHTQTSAQLLTNLIEQIKQAPKVLDANSVKK